MPSNLLLKFARRLWADSAQQSAFIQALVQPQPLSPCILWNRPRPESLPFAIAPPLPWQPEFVDRLAVSTRPGQHEWHQQGYYYCLDFSSVFAASPLLTLPAQPALVVDLCAAPGGKSLFAAQALQPQFLLSNEVIGKRLGMLISNLRRCQADPAAVVSLDSQILAEQLPEQATVAIVDAPCTGQSLLAKGEKAPGCFHPVTINQNANRQKRILANAAQLVAPQGYLAYMTCAFSPEENEQVSSWFLARFPQFQPLAVPHLQAYQSHLSDLPCYRLWPQSGLGAGGFTILLQNTNQAAPPLIEPLDLPYKWTSQPMT
ncbi:MAG: RsmB/NOP family class I SAM-dependent RNA methyltransferase [Aphanocapsa sp. GSE-SYN-MK-11-07L]|jgi:16S rRNA C967 or C1407 C5-methylase (RsmB/RsmF family)|nr:RsmB/NOP family class I SAM-dependent RNA methyltransferase [Aphanocapsa sp. GSE-SYN-MK-11-07L]